MCASMCLPGIVSKDRRREGRKGVSSHFFFFLGLFSLVCFGVSLNIQFGLSFHPQSDDAHVADLIGS